MVTCTPDTPHISIIVPVYNESESLAELNQKLKDMLGNYGHPWELIYVNDGSTDGSEAVIRNFSEEDERIRQVHFRRNQGKAEALNQGFRISGGRFVATIDADLQDDPEVIPEMIKKLEDENLDIVSGWKQNRQDRLIKRYSSRFFNFTVRLLTGIKLHDINNGLKVYRREVIKKITIYGEMHRFVPVLAKQQGYMSGEIKVKHFPRKYGVTKYGVSRFFQGIP